MSVHGVPMPWWTAPVAGALMIAGGVLALIRIRNNPPTPTLVTLTAMQGAATLKGPVGARRQLSMVIPHGTAVAIRLKQTARVNHGTMKLYGVVVSTPHGGVLYDFRLRPKAIDVTGLVRHLTHTGSRYEVDASLPQPWRDNPGLLYGVSSSSIAPGSPGQTTTWNAAPGADGGSLSR